MLFLMNDRVLQLSDADEADLARGRFDAISSSYAVRLGQELFAETPMLHREWPDRARRLAVLIRAKAPEVNAGLFVAPSVGCRPDQVITRFANLSIDLLASLLERDRAEGGLTPVQADREVWRRFAA